MQLFALECKPLAEAGWCFRRNFGACGLLPWSEHAVSSGFWPRWYARNSYTSLPTALLCRSMWNLGIALRRFGFEIYGQQQLSSWVDLNSMQRSAAVKGIMFVWMHNFKVLNTLGSFLWGLKMQGGKRMSEWDEILVQQLRLRDLKTKHVKFVFCRD